VILGLGLASISIIIDSYRPHQSLKNSYRSWIILIRDFKAEIDIPTDDFLAAGLAA
jgi:hypothetical protein